MTQRERDRLVALKKADKKLITQKQAAQQLGLSERQDLISPGSPSAPTLGVSCPASPRPGGCWPSCAAKATRP